MTYIYMIYIFMTYIYDIYISYITDIYIYIYDPPFSMFFWGDPACPRSGLISQRSRVTQRRFLPFRNRRQSDPSIGIMAFSWPAWPGKITPSCRTLCPVTGLGWHWVQTYYCSRSPSTHRSMPLVKKNTSFEALAAVAETGPKRWIRFGSSKFNRETAWRRICAFFCGGIAQECSKLPFEWGKKSWEHLFFLPTQTNMWGLQSFGPQELKMIRLAPEKTIPKLWKTMW